LNVAYSQTVPVSVESWVIFGQGPSHTANYTLTATATTATVTTPTYKLPKEGMMFLTVTFNNVALTVGYDYDKNGHMVVKRFKEPVRTALPIEDAYTWEGERLTRIERAVKGHITRYTYDTADRVVGVESVVVDGDRERIESVIELETTCDADKESDD
jgi:YD repeat-containing protein